MAKRYPHTVAEARAVRGPRLVEDLQEVILEERSAMAKWPLVLDILANDQKTKPSEIAVQVVSDLESPQAVLPRKLQGPHAANPPSSKADSQAGNESVRWLREMQSLIKVYIGKDLEPMWLTKQGKLRPELLERVERVKDRVLAQFGITMPHVLFMDSSWDPKIPGNGFRIEVLYQRKKAEPVLVGNENALDRLSSALTGVVGVNRIHFLSAEDVHRELEEGLKEKPGLQTWLRDHYSLTDLKVVLRAVINPSRGELFYREQDQKTKATEQTFPAPPERNICHPDWLLASLVFWSKVHDPQSGVDLVNDLRKTQSARLVSNPPPPTNGGIVNAIDAGVKSLNQGDIPQAENAFNRALKSNRDAAISCFLALYPQGLRKPELIQARINYFLKCLDLYYKFTKQDWETLDLKLQLFGLFIQEGEMPTLRSERVELEALVMGKDFEDIGDPASARRLLLSLLAAYPEEYIQTRRHLAANIARRYGNPDQWPPDEAAWYGTQLLTWFDPVIDNKDNTIQKTAMDFLKSALPHLQFEKARRQYERILQIVGKPGPNLWCWNLLPDLAKLRKEPEIRLLVADRLTYHHFPIDLQQALVLTDQAQKELNEHPLPGKQQQLMLAWADLVKARALLQLSDTGAGKDTAEAEGILLKLASSQTSWPEPDIELASFREKQGRLDDALAYLDKALKKLPKNRKPDEPDPMEANIYGLKFSVVLRTGKKEAVQQVAEEARQKIRKDKEGRVTEDTSGFAFVAALGMLITDADGCEKVSLEFLQTDHEYVPYVAMMLYSRLGGKGQTGPQKVIQDRWDQARGNWEVRLSQGDQTAWREMLIGYYLGEVTRELIFANLDDEAHFANSGIKGIMPLREMRCEVYFYDALLAKIKGKRDQTVNSSLEKVVGTDASNTFEYGMAKFLLAQQKKDTK